MTDAEILIEIKAGLGITGRHMDKKLRTYIDEVQRYMVGAGVRGALVNSDAAVGCILIGVNDIMNYQPGGVRLSDYFKDRVIQLSAESGDY